MANKQSSYDRIPPHNLEAEESLLGSMLLSKEVIDEIHELVEPEDFYRESNGKIYQAITELYGHNEPVDAITLAELLKRKNWLSEIGGKSYIHTLVNVVPTAANALHYANIVNDSSLLRRMIRSATEIAALGYSIPEDVDEAINQAEAMILEVSKKREMGSIETIGELLSEAYDELELLSGADGTVIGTGTGFRELDDLAGGFRPSDFIVVAGRPGMGKTSFALTIAQNVALEQKKPVLVFSLEMSKVELSMRILCSDARVNARNLRSSSLKEEEWKRVASAMNRLSDAPITINDAGNITMVGIRSVARRMNNKSPLGLIIVDYMQLMTGHGRSENRQQEVSEISRAMKLLARELDVPVMGISQLSRGPENRTDKRPMLSDLRESGAIEQDADQVMFIYREEEYDKHTDDKGIAEILLRKHRHGPTGTIRLAFIENYTKFDNLDTRHTEDF
jgi:replicative DNA helicase